MKVVAGRELTGVLRMGKSPQGFTAQEVPAGDWCLQSVTTGLDRESSPEMLKCVWISSRTLIHHWGDSERSRGDLS